MRYKDKVKHFLVSFLISSFVFWLIKFKFITIVFVLLLGLLKELFDQARGRNTVKESMADILINVLGITFGLLFTHYLLLI